MTRAPGPFLFGTAAGAEARTAAAGGKRNPEALRLMEAAVERSNMLGAYERVVKNQGAPGVERTHGDRVQAMAPGTLAEDKTGTVGRRVHAGGGAQGGHTQAARWGPYFLGYPDGTGSSDSTGTASDVATAVRTRVLRVELRDGFRPGRNAHQAVKAARSYVAEGKRWVVDLDLEKFFDRVNHDVLMARVARKVKDERVLKLIRRYLEAGMMEGGMTSVRTEGTPQGGPLSPLFIKHPADRPGPRNWKNVGTASAAMQTTATCTLEAGGAGSG